MKVLKILKEHFKHFSKLINHLIGYHWILLASLNPCIWIAWAYMASKPIEKNKRYPIGFDILLFDKNFFLKRKETLLENSKWIKNTSIMITIKNSSKLEGLTNYVVWKFEIRTTLMKKSLWDLHNPKFIKT